MRRKNFETIYIALSVIKFARIGNKGSEILDERLDDFDVSLAWELYPIVRGIARDESFSLPSRFSFYLSRIFLFTVLLTRVYLSRFIITRGQ